MVGIFFINQLIKHNKIFSYIHYEKTKEDDSIFFFRFVGRKNVLVQDALVAGFRGDSVQII